MTKRLWFILLAFLSLLLSCKQDESLNTPTDTGYTKTIHYKVKVKGSVSTRASLNGDTQYIFEANDRLFVSHIESGNTVLYGVLSLMSGAGSTTAIFEGDLACLEEFDVQSSTPIDVTLVSSADRLHSFAEGKITGTDYPDDEFASSLAEAVQKFSNFTCSTTFGSRSITLEQNSTFLVCTVTMSTDDMPEDTNADISIESGGASIWSGTVTSDISAGHSVLNFVLAFPGDEIELDTPELIIEWVDGNDDDQIHTFSDLTDGALLASNNFYTITRTTIVHRYGGFRIIALANGTITGSNFTTLEYTLDEGETWNSYSSGISVTAGDEVCFRAGSADATDDGSHHKKIVSSAAFKVAGDMASLLTGANFGTPSATIPNSYTFVNFFTNCTQLTDASGLVISMPTAPGSSFKSFFEGCTNLVSGPAELSATTIKSTCYRNMFSGCTSLTSAPIIRKPTTHNDNGWYQQMFKNCSSLQEIVFLDDYAYNAVNFKKNNNEVGWVYGVNASGTFYKSSTMTTFPNPGEASTPTGWTVVDYVEPTP